MLWGRMKASLVRPGIARQSLSRPFAGRGNSYKWKRWLLDLKQPGFHDPNSSEKEWKCITMLLRAERGTIVPALFLDPY
jgi:hypothetical protein